MLRVLLLISINPQHPTHMKTKSKFTPGAFQIMAGFKSYEIQHWLDTTPSSVASALFESGAELEQQGRDLLRQRDELAKALKELMRCFIGDRNTQNCLGGSGIAADNARTILARVGKEGEK